MLPPSADPAVILPLPSTSSDPYFEEVSSDFQQLYDETQEVSALDIRESLLKEVKNDNSEHEKKKKREDDHSMIFHPSAMSVMHNYLLRDIFSEFSAPCKKCNRKLELDIIPKAGNNTIRIKCVRCKFAKDFPSRHLYQGGRILPSKAQR